MPKKTDEQPAIKPDNTSKKQDGGYLFTAWGIHVAAKSEQEAKKIILDTYGKDVDVDQPPLNDDKTDLE